jgi:hypothetical protein
MSDMWELSHRSDLREIKRSRLRLSHMSDMWEIGMQKIPKGVSPRGFFVFTCS